jgi:hypothetical protein
MCVRPRQSGCTRPQWRTKLASQHTHPFLPTLQGGNAHDREKQASTHLLHTQMRTHVRQQQCAAPGCAHAPTPHTDTTAQAQAPKSRLSQSSTSGEPYTHPTHQTPIPPPQKSTHACTRKAPGVHASTTAPQHVANAGHRAGALLVCGTANSKTPKKCVPCTTAAPNVRQLLGPTPLNKRARMHACTQALSLSRSSTVYVCVLAMRNGHGCMAQQQNWWPAPRVQQQ